MCRQLYKIRDEFLSMNDKIKLFFVFKMQWNEFQIFFSVFNGIKGTTGNELLIKTDKIV